MTVKIRKCRTCGEKKPLTTEYWRQYHKAPEGFMIHCKKCTQESIKAHYRKWYARDVHERGETGVRCILWAEVCDECPCPSDMELEKCWRLTGTDPDSEEYPDPLPQ